MDAKDSDARPAIQPAGRVVLCNIGRAGDTILRNSILDSVYRTFGEVSYICGRGNLELIRSDPRHRHVIFFRNTLAGFGEVLRAMLRGRYDAYIDLKDHASSTSLILARLFLATRKTGVNRPRNRPFHYDTKGVALSGQHKIEAIKRIAAAAGLQLAEFRPSLVCPADSQAWFQTVWPTSNPFVLLNVSATHPNRMWPADRWIEYLRAVELPDWPILVNSVPADRELAQAIVAAVPRTRLMQPRQFMDVAAAVRRARLVLTVNTGVMHACSAFDTPIVVVANGPFEIREFAPLSARQLIIEAAAPRTVPDLTATEAIEASRGRLPI